MTKPPVNQKLIDAIFEAAQLGTITAQEFEAEMTAAGLTVVDGPSIDEVLDDVLPKLYAASRKGQSRGMRLYLASLLVKRGLTCGCEACRAIEAEAKEWQQFKVTQATK